MKNAIALNLTGLANAVKSGLPSMIERAPEALRMAAAEIERLHAIEAAAQRFVKEADESPRYISVRTWATPEADPYLKLRAALHDGHVRLRNRKPRRRGARLW